MLPTAAAVMLGGAATAADLPAYEIMGFPITQVQLLSANSANIKERPPAPTLTLGGMPASPHQIAVLTPRERLAPEVAIKHRQDLHVR